MTDNMEIWNKLCETDPEHTQKFQRPGGFKGTAIKPMWAIKRMTEEFGPCGTGWGMYRPTFDWQDNCGLVFCTVGVWYYDAEFQETKDVYGVGGDRFTGLRANGNSFVDDEAFKKAYTDAIMNALKFIGVGADVHMGIFDDNKYEELKERKTTDTDPKDGADLPIPRGQVTKTRTDRSVVKPAFKINGGLPCHLLVSELHCFLALIRAVEGHICEVFWPLSKALCNYDPCLHFLLRVRLLGHNAPAVISRASHQG